MTNMILNRSLGLLAGLLLLPCMAWAQPAITGLSQWSIYLDPGHSQTENMGVYNYSEAQKVLRVALQVKDLLETHTDIDTVYTSRTNDNQLVSLAQRTDHANRVGASFFHSIHSNAGAASTNNVLMLWAQRGNGEEKVPNGGKAMSDIMIRLLSQGMRLPSIGSRGDCSFYGTCSPSSAPYLYVNRTSAMASTLSEAGFHTNPTQNMKNMNAEWKRMEAWIHFLTYLDYNGVDRPFVGIVNGIVSDLETGQTLNGATITLDGRSYTTDTFESLFKNYTSNPDLLSNGYYYFEGLSEGTFELVASAPGHYSDTLHVSVVDTFFTFQDIQLVSSLPPSVTSSTPANGQEGFRYSDPVVVTFSRPMNTASVEAAFTLEPATTGTFVWAANDTRLTFTPDALTPLTDYTLTIGETALDKYDHPFDADGDGTPGGSLTITFSTGPEDIVPPAVAATHPANNAFVDELHPVISVAFDEVIRPEDLVPENFTLSLFSNAAYEVGGTLQWANVDNRTVVNFFPERKLAADRVWRFVTAAGLRDLTGNATTSARTLRFRTSFDDVDFRIAESFNSGIGSWWLPSQSGSTTGTVPDSTVAAADASRFLGFTSSGSSYRFKYGWDAESSSPLVRIYTPPGSSVRGVTFDQQSLVQMYVFGDGSGTKIRFAVEDQDPGTARLEVSPWQTIDWIGWKLVTWDVEQDGVGEWIGNGVLNGRLALESIQLTRGEAGTAFGTVWFDDLRIATRVTATDIADETVDTPSSFSLEQNYPNPFNPTTTIAFNMANAGPVTLTVYNVMGQKVAEVLTGVSLQAGRHEVQFDASRLASGTYVYRLTAEGVELSRKMVLVK